MIEIKSFSALSGAEFDRFLTQFCQIQDLVRTPPYRRGLLPSPVWIGLLCQPTKFAKEFWLALDGLGRCIGRIGASVSARPDELGRSTGAIGFFEIDVQHPSGKDAAASLLAGAEAWLRGHGVQRAHGPMNFSMWYQYRFRQGIASAGEPGFDWEPLNPPEYIDVWKASGFQVSETYVTRGFEGLTALAAETRAAHELALSAGFTFHSLDSMRILDVDIKALYEVSMAALSSGTHFEPISLEAFRALYIPLAGSADLGLSHLARERSGKAAAFYVCFEDHEQLIFRRRACVPGAHGHRLLPALAHLAAERAATRGLSRFVTALESSTTPSIAPGLRPLWERRYALLAKNLA